MEAVSFPVVEGVVTSFLNAEFTSRAEPARAGTKVPAERGPFVKVTRVGGTRSLVHEDVMVTFECWAKKTPDAANLARLTRALVGSLDTGAVWFRREVGGPAFFPDPQSDDPRYQFTALLRTRGEAI